MPTFERFEQLEDADFFTEFVKDQFLNGWEAVSKASGSTVAIDDAMIGLAYDRYKINLQQYTVALKSQNPDQYKRAGALLHAIYSAPPIVTVHWSDETMRLRNPEAVGVSHDDAEFWNKYCAWYEDHCNRLMAFDLAFRCCQVYEVAKKSYDQDYLDNVCYYMAENTNINVGSFVMILKSYMADGRP